MNNQERKVTVGSLTGFAPAQGQDGQIYMTETWDMLPDQESLLADNLRRNHDLSVKVTLRGFDVDMGEGDVVRYRVEGESVKAWLTRHQVAFTEDRGEMTEEEKLLTLESCEIFQLGEDDVGNGNPRRVEMPHEDVVSYVNAKNVQRIVLLSKWFKVYTGPFAHSTFSVEGAFPEDWLRSVLPNITPTLSKEAKLAESMYASRDAAVALEKANLPLNENATQGENMKKKQVTISASYGFTRGVSDNNRASAPFIEVWSPAPFAEGVGHYINAHSDKEVLLTPVGFDLVLSNGETTNFRIDGAKPEEWLKENCWSGITERTVGQSAVEVFEHYAAELTEDSLASTMKRIDETAFLLELNSTRTQHILLTTLGFETHGPYGKRVFSVKGVGARDWLVHAIGATIFEITEDCIKDFDSSRASGALPVRSTPRDNKTYTVFEYMRLAPTSLVPYTGKWCAIRSEDAVESLQTSGITSLEVVSAVLRVTTLDQAADAREFMFVGISAEDWVALSGVYRFCAQPYGVPLGNPQVNAPAKEEKEVSKPEYSATYTVSEYVTPTTGPEWVQRYCGEWLSVKPEDVVKSLKDAGVKCILDTGLIVDVTLRNPEGGVRRFALKGISGSEWAALLTPEHLKIYSSSTIGAFAPTEESIQIPTQGATVNTKTTETKDSDDNDKWTITMNTKKTEIKNDKVTVSKESEVVQGEIAGTEDGQPYVVTLRNKASCDTEFDYSQYAVVTKTYADTELHSEQSSQHEHREAKLFLWVASPAENGESIAQHRWSEVSSEHAVLIMADLQNSRVVVVNKYMTLLSAYGDNTYRFKVEGDNPLQWLKTHSPLPYTSSCED